MRIAVLFRSFVVLAVLLSSSSPSSAAPVPALEAARALIVVTTADWDSTQARLQAFHRVDGHWQPAAPAFAVALGQHGSA